MWLLVIAILAAAAAATTYNVSTVVLGTATEFSDYARSTGVICAIELSIERLNANSRLLPDTKIIQRAMKSNCSSQDGVHAMLDAASNNSLGYTAGTNGPLIGVIGPGCSNAGTVLASRTAVLMSVCLWQPRRWLIWQRIQGMFFQLCRTAQLRQVSAPERQHRGL